MRCRRTEGRMCRGAFRGSASALAHSGRIDGCLRGTGDAPNALIDRPPCAQRASASRMVWLRMFCSVEFTKQNGYGPSAQRRNAAARPDRGGCLLALHSALKRVGRQRNIVALARRIQAALRSEQLAAPTQVTAAFAATTRATVGIIAELNHQISELETSLAEHFEKHPDADIYRSLIVL